MKCPYCNKRVYDMPAHLKAYKQCHERHIRKLTIILQADLAMLNELEVKWQCISDSE